jgi:hypothetical protein
MRGVLNLNRENQKNVLTFNFKRVSTKRRPFNRAIKVLVDGQTKRLLKIKKATWIKSFNYIAKKKITLVLRTLVLTKKKSRIITAKLLEKKTLWIWILDAQEINVTKENIFNWKTKHGILNGKYITFISSKQVKYKGRKIKT